MLSRIHELMAGGVDFAFETTLATRSYVSLIKSAQGAGYKVTLLFIWLDSSEAAARRVADRVRKGGHNIPGNVIERRYYRGIFNLYIPVSKRWMVVNNVTIVPEPVAEGAIGVDNIIINEYIWQVINDQAKRHDSQ